MLPMPDDVTQPQSKPHLRILIARFARKRMQSLSLTRQLLLLWGAIALITALIASQSDPSMANRWLGAGALLALPGGILLWLRRQIVQPIRRIDQQLLMLSKGNLPEPLAISTSDEFATLSHLLNQVGSLLKTQQAATQEMARRAEQSAAKLLEAQAASQAARTSLKETKADLRETRVALQKDRTKLREAWQSLKDVRADLKERNSELKTLRDELRITRIQSIERQVQQAENGYSNADQPPVLFFNVSSHTYNLSFNGTVGLLAAWSLRLAGQPVTYLVCHSGLEKCLLGTRPADLSVSPPCDICIANNTSWYPAQHTIAFQPNKLGDGELQSKFGGMTIEQLITYRYGAIAIGELCVPSVRWRLRRWNIDADPAGRDLLAIYVASAIALAQRLEKLFAEQPMRSLLLFNGTFFPEATARAVAQQHNIPVITYESGFQPLSAFFSHDVATEYSIRVPADFQLGDDENAQLDDYLAQRLKGNFTMAGVRFWQDMQSISPELKQKAQAHQQVVVIFTNVVFDTSQTYANLIFESMFDWLEATLTLAAQHSDTLFIIRAHPDELRQHKESQEPVGEWLEASPFNNLPNLSFIAPTEYVSSYELIDLSQFCLIYNSTIGLEATLMGKPVIAAGQTRYDRENMVYKAASSEAYLELVRQFLQSGAPPVSEAWQQRARRFMYYSLFCASLDLSPFTDQAYLYNYTLKPFEAEALHPDRSTVMDTIYSGIINCTPFTVR
jgi:hypothetical protein